jgi:threonine dehydratase
MTFVVCTSGGGLTAGIAVALAELAPQVALYTAEPEDYDDHRRSWQRGVVSATSRACRLRSATPCSRRFPGELTFAINQPRLRGGLAVSDAEVRRAIAFAARTLKVIVEPGGAVALAAVLSGKLDVSGRTVAITLSGGNIDDAMLADILLREPT